MLRQLLVGAAVSVCNIAVHALVMATVVQISSRIAGAKETVRRSQRLTTVMIATASIATVPVLMAAHISEVMVWSLAYAIVDAAPAGADPGYFAFVNYTTPGCGDVTPVERGRLLGPMTATNGVPCLGGRPPSYSRCCGELRGAASRAVPRAEYPTRRCNGADVVPIAFGKYLQGRRCPPLICSQSTTSQPMRALDYVDQTL
jgi:hypothetical protein